MDIRTGETYPTLEAALDAGVPRADIAEVRSKNGQPIVKFSKGSFKSFTRDKDGQLVQVK